MSGHLYLPKRYGFKTTVHVDLVYIRVIHITNLHFNAFAIFLGTFLYTYNIQDLFVLTWALVHMCALGLISFCGLGYDDNVKWKAKFC